MMREILLCFRENRMIFAAMMQSKHGSDYLECLQKAVYSNILEIVRHFYGRVPEKYDEDVAKHFAGYISDSVYGVLHRDLQSGMTEDVDEIIRDYKRFHNEAYSIKFEKYMRSIRQENM
ncbi:MAG: TetR/AcrR family transcriptional regulator C-terminal domain-containing protein [Oscillospiraceae bacterium]|nr:TetR/AcrR family transcriptional regulator C-terminal domain-containing protein [Oscillospiraceae bacterium]